MTDDEVIEAAAEEGCELCWRPVGGGGCASGSSAETTSRIRRRRDGVFT